VRSPEFYIRQDFRVQFPERLFGEPPAYGSGRKERPLLIGREFGGTVIAPVNFKQIALLKVIVHPEKATGDPPFLITSFGCYTLSQCEVDVIGIFINNPVTASGEILVLGLL